LGREMFIKRRFGLRLKKFGNHWYKGWSCWGWWCILCPFM